MSPSYRTPIAVVIACCSVAACASHQVHVSSSPGETAPAPSTPTPTPPSGSATGLKWTATLAPQTGGTTTGTATVAPGTTAGTTVVTLSLTGGAPGATYPWHVHNGQCGDQGPVVGSGAAYPPLIVGNNGTAQATATIPLPTPASGNYYVNVHASPTEMGTSISCGNLTMQGM
jgi:hypothetical protein